MQYYSDMAIERTAEDKAKFQAAQADLEASARYRYLAERNPSLRRDYLKRAALAEQIGRSKLAEVTSAN